MKFKIISSHKLGLGKKPRGSLSHHFHKKLKNNLFPNRRDICKELIFSWFFLFFSSLKALTQIYGTFSFLTDALHSLMLLGKRDPGSEIEDWMLD